MFEFNRTPALAALTVAALTLAACGGAPESPTATPAPQPTATAQPTATPQPAAEPTATAAAAAPEQKPTETPQADAAPVVNPRTLTRVKVSAPVQEQKAVLAQIGTTLGEQPAAAGDQATPQAPSAFRTTYRLELQLGSDPADPLEYVTEVDREGRVRYQTSFVDSDGKQASVSIYTVGETSYTIASANPDFCVALTEDAPAGVPQPRDWLDTIASAELAEQGVEVNGFITDRYTFKEKVESPQVQAEISGEVWVARGSNIIVRHRGESVGKMLAAAIAAASEESGATPSANMMQDARIAWEYDIAPIEDDFEVEIPEACLKGGDLPMPPGIKNTMRAGGMTSFDVEAPAADIVTFYKDAMKQAGWTLAEETSYGDTAIMKFEKDGQTVLVQVTKGQDVTSVIVLAE